jgi:lipocalin
MNGTAVVVNASEPNKLNVRFNGLNYPMKANTTNYNVMSTDYSTYSVVYSCTSYSLDVMVTTLTLKDEYLWILSRNKTLDAGLTANIISNLTTAGLQVSNLIPVSQDCNIF